MATINGSIQYALMDAGVDMCREAGRTKGVCRQANVKTYLASRWQLRCWQVIHCATLTLSTEGRCVGYGMLDWYRGIVSCSLCQLLPSGILLLLRETSIEGSCSTRALQDGCLTCQREPFGNRLSTKAGAALSSRSAAEAMLRSTCLPDMKRWCESSNHHLDPGPRARLKDCL